MGTSQKKSRLKLSSAFVKKTTNRSLSFFLAAGTGFEPVQNESESLVLPLHYPAIFISNYYMITQKNIFVNTFFEKNR